MAEGFTRALAKGHWTVPTTLHQTKIFSEIVADRPKPVAYFFVDAMRFEMGARPHRAAPEDRRSQRRDPPSRLFRASRHSVWRPCCRGHRGASASLKRAASWAPGSTMRSSRTSLRERSSRRRGYRSSWTSRSTSCSSLQPTKLAKKVEGAQVVIVRSQEIDHAGEAGFTFQARQVMDTVIDNLARAIRKLADAGVEHAVVTADHGHLFFPDDRDESMRTDSPGGDKVELHRRCWIGRGGRHAAGLRSGCSARARLRVGSRVRLPDRRAASSRPAATSPSTTGGPRCRRWSSPC